MNQESPIRLLFSRRSVRRYQPRPITRQQIEQLLEAATWAPSAHNRQPWRFVVIETTALKEQLARTMGQQLRQDLTTDGLPAQLIEQDANRSYQRLTNAPTVILICLCMSEMDGYPDQRRNHHEWVMAVQSTAMAGQNLLLAAEGLGLAACWMCAPLFCAEQVCQLLALPADWQPQGLVTVGYPAETKSKTRHPLAQKVKYL